MSDEHKKISKRKLNIATSPSANSVFIAILVFFYETQWVSVHIFEKPFFEGQPLVSIVQVWSVFVIIGLTIPFMLVNLLYDNHRKSMKVILVTISCVLLLASLVYGGTYFMTLKAGETLGWVQHVNALVFVGFGILSMLQMTLVVGDVTLEEVTRLSGDWKEMKRRP